MTGQSVMQRADAEYEVLTNPAAQVLLAQAGADCDSTAGRFRPLAQAIP